MDIITCISVGLIVLAVILCLIGYIVEDDRYFIWANLLCLAAVLVINFENYII